MEKIVIVGAGLGGLTAAGLLSKRGFRVKLLERSPIAGGRSHVWKKDGFTMSYGAHGIVCPNVDPVQSIFKELGIRFDEARKPSVSGFKLYGNGKVMSSPLGSGMLTTPAIDGLPNRLAFLRRFLGLSKLKSEQLPSDMTVEQWLDSQQLAPSVKKVIRAYIWVTFYERALDRLPIRDFAEYAGLLYSKMNFLLYMSYESLLQQLQQAITTAGGQIEFGRESVGLQVENGQIKGVVTKDGIESADRVILNVPPQAIAKLSSGTPLEAEISPLFGQPAQYVYVHDVMLSRRLSRDVSNVLDLDDGVYINDMSFNVPSSAPAEGHLLNTMRFLNASEQEDDSHVDASKEKVQAVLDRVYPEWRRYLIGERVIKRAMVNGIARSLNAKRLPNHSSTVSGLFFVGDSVEGRGGLGVPAYESAWEAANAIAVGSADARYVKL